MLYLYYHFFSNILLLLLRPKAGLYPKCVIPFALFRIKISLWLKWTVLPMCTMASQILITFRILLNHTTTTTTTRLRWSRGSVLAFGTQVREFKPDRRRWIFQGEKILSTPSFGGEVKRRIPCRRFTARKRSLNVTWKSGIFRQNSSANYRPCSSTFGC